LVVGGDDAAAVGSRVAPGWVTVLWRQHLREHLLALDSGLSLRAVEREEELLVAKFLDVATATVDGFWAGREPEEVCARLWPCFAGATAALYSVARPLVKKLASSKDAFDKELWRQVRRSLFGSSSVSSTSEESESESESGTAGATDGAKAKKKSRRDRRALLKAHKKGAGVGAGAQKDKSPTFEDFEGANASTNATTNASINASTNTSTNAGTNATTNATTNVSANAGPKGKIKRVKAGAPSQKGKKRTRKASAPQPKKKKGGK